ncbi:methyltransferase [Microbacterium sp. NPDC057407]|uniref:methyltransferase family protein n=1 Tax=Microbacterium sp. NPDC057407 TaxID=3346120 RepID=UPI00366B5268
MTTALSTLLSPAPLARTYFAAQALAGSIWWLGVFAVPFVRTATLGSLDPVTLAVLDVPLFVVTSALAAVPARWGRVAALAATAWTCAVTVFLVGYATLTGEAGWGVVLMAAAAIVSTGATCLLWWGRIPTEWALAGPFAFRPARSRRGSAGHMAVTLAQIVVFWGLFLGLIPLALQALESRWGLSAEFPWAIRVLGGVVLILASALGLWSAFAMSVHGDGTPLPASMANRLVVSGPYRFVRNPMAVAGCAQGAAVGLLMSSWLVVVYAVLGSLLWNYAVRPLEEADLEQRFGDEFLRYRDAVRCWVPRLQRYGAPPGT